jgi:hypothetical protein
MSADRPAQRATGREQRLGTEMASAAEVRQLRAELAAGRAASSEQLLKLAKACTAFADASETRITGMAQLVQRALDAVQRAQPKAEDVMARPQPH